MLEFIEFPAFTQRLDALAGHYAEDVRLRIEDDLLKNAERGAVLQGTAGIRKARVADPMRGKGKRGGYRYLCYYIEQDGQAYLLMIFSKNERDDLNPDQKKALANAARQLRDTK